MIAFENGNSWVWIVIVFLLLIFIGLDLKFQTPRHRTLRILSIILVIFSLSLVYLKPAIWKSAPKDNLVITSNWADQKTVDSLKSKGYHKFDNTYNLETHGNSIEKIAIVGDGLEYWELEELKWPMIYFPSEKLEGIISINHTEAIAKSSFMIEGQTYLKSEIELRLGSPDNSDYHQILNETNNDFSFTVSPKTPGNFIYELIATRENDTLFHEYYPVVVKPSQTYEILILTAFPTFEIKFLKNNLAAKGHGISYRYSTTNELTSDEFINTKSKNLNKVNNQLLESIALLLIDPQTYKRLSSEEKNTVTNFIQKGKIGMIFIGDPSDIPIYKTTSDQNDFILFNGKKNKIEVQYQPSVIVSPNHQNILVKDEIIGAYVKHNIGKSAVCYLDASHQLILKGEDELYNEIWESIIKNVIGYDYQSTPISIDQQFSIIDYPITLNFNSLNENPLLFVDSERITVMESALRKGYYHSTYWPYSRGWHKVVHMPDSQVTKFYTNSEEAWLAYRQKKLHNANLLASLTQPNYKVNSKTIKEPMSKWYFFLLFLIGAGYLWLEQRLNG